MEVEEEEEEEKEERRRAGGNALSQLGRKDGRGTSCPA